MEAKFQDLLKNIIPGFFIVFSITILCYFVNIVPLILLMKKVIKLPVELIIVTTPFVLFLIGYINDSISSQIEFWIYECGLSRPSFSILNNKTKRYNLSNLSTVKSRINIEDSVQEINRSKTYDYFKKANDIKKSNEELKEFYLSYVFSRNLMVAALIALLTSILFVILYFSMNAVICVIVCLIIFILFSHRWRQRAFYYTRKVFINII